MINKIIDENIIRVNENIAKACSVAGRNITDIEVVLASKTQNIGTLEYLNKLAGYKIFAENKVQEFCSKYTNKFIWDFIGQLQTNKVKYLIDGVRFIQSVDRDSLCVEIQKRAFAVNKIQEVFVQINAGNELSKGGISFSETEDFIMSIKNKYPNISVKGLMIVTPKDISDRETHIYFEKSYAKFQAIKSIDNNVKYLSMGMSCNYETAILEGANLIRLGTAVFGERVQNNENQLQNNM